MPKFVRQGDNTLTGNNTFTGNNIFSGSTDFGSTTATTLVATTLNAGNPIVSTTITDIDAQNGAPVVAEIAGGMVTHNSKTGAGTLTVPTGTEMTNGVLNAAVGVAVKWLYYNYGNQTVTITAAADHTLVGGTAAVTTGKHMEIISVCTGVNTWKSFLTTLM